MEETRIEFSQGNFNNATMIKEIEYRGYLITQNTTGYVGYDFYLVDAEVVKGNGKTIDDCKVQIDEILEDEEC